MAAVRERVGVKTVLARLLAMIVCTLTLCCVKAGPSAGHAGTTTSTSHLMMVPRWARSSSSAVVQLMVSSEDCVVVLGRRLRGWLTGKPSSEPEEADAFGLARVSRAGDVGWYTELATPAGRPVSTGSSVGVVSRRGFVGLARLLLQDDGAVYTLTVDKIDASNGHVSASVEVRGVKGVLDEPRLDGMQVTGDGAFIVAGYLPGRLSSKEGLVYGSESSSSETVLLRFDDHGVSAKGRWIGGNERAFLGFSGEVDQGWLVYPLQCVSSCFMIARIGANLDVRPLRMVSAVEVGAVAVGNRDELMLVLEAGASSGLVLDGMGVRRLLRVSLDGVYKSNVGLGSVVVQSASFTRGDSLVLSGYYYADKPTGALALPKGAHGQKPGFLAALSLDGHLQLASTLGSDASVASQADSSGVTLLVEHRGPLLWGPGLVASGGDGGVTMLRGELRMSQK